MKSEQEHRHDLELRESKRVDKALNEDIIIQKRNHIARMTGLFIAFATVVIFFGGTLFLFIKGEYELGVKVLIYGAIAIAALFLGKNITSKFLSTK